MERGLGREAAPTKFYYEIFLPYFPESPLLMTRSKGIAALMALCWVTVVVSSTAADQASKETAPSAKPGQTATSPGAAGALSSPLDVRDPNTVVIGKVYPEVDSTTQ